MLLVSADFALVVLVLVLRLVLIRHLLYLLMLLLSSAYLITC